MWVPMPDALNLISPKTLIQDPSLSLGSSFTWEAQGSGSEAHSSNSELSKCLGNVWLRYISVRYALLARRHV